jgi:aryl-alcohol dehydrogenase-like predicted oxidoreductase
MKFIDFEDYKISKLSLGTVQFGLNYGIANLEGKPSQEKVSEIVEFVINKGINCFDTAQAYGNSELVLGNALQGKRDIFLISKIKSDNFNDSLNGNLLHSLENLNSNYLFGLLLHDSELLYNWTEKKSEVVNVLKERNIIKYFGVSIYTSEDFDLAINNDDITIIQIPFNIFDLRALNEKWIEKAQLKGKLIFIRSVFLQGLLLMNIDMIPAKLSKAKKYLETFENFAKELNISKSELALSFVETVAKDSILLFGCDNLIQAEENLENYKNLKPLDKDTTVRIITEFSDINEDIYLPTRW